MKKISKISGSFLTIAALSCIFWMGSYLLRMIITYQLFDETIKEYRNYITDLNINGILTALNPAVITTFALFLSFLLFYFLFLVTSGINLRKNGWLFIITVLVLITAPFEIYLMTIDYRIFTRVAGGSFQSSEVVSLIIKRFKSLSSFPLIELLCYSAVIFLAIFKPLKKKDE
jgi:hypothetical protein